MYCMNEQELVETAFSVLKKYEEEVRGFLEKYCLMTSIHLAVNTTFLKMTRKLARMVDERVFGNWKLLRRMYVVFRRFLLINQVVSPLHLNP